MSSNPPGCTCIWDEEGNLTSRTRDCPYPEHQDFSGEGDAARAGNLPPAPAISATEMTTSAPQSNRKLFIGLAAGVLLYALNLAASMLWGSGEQGYWSLFLISGMVLLTVVVSLVGVVLVSLAKTRKLGAGLLIGVAAGLVVDGGACVALLMAGV